MADVPLAAPGPGALQQGRRAVGWSPASRAVCCWTCQVRALPCNAGRPRSDLTPCAKTHSPHTHHAVSNNGARCRHIIYKKGLEDLYDIQAPTVLGGLKSEAYLKLNPQARPGLGQARALGSAVGAPTGGAAAACPLPCVSLLTPQPPLPPVPAPSAASAAAAHLPAASAGGQPTTAAQQLPPALPPPPRARCRCWSWRTAPPCQRARSSPSTCWTSTRGAGPPWLRQTLRRAPGGRWPPASTTSTLHPCRSAAPPFLPPPALPAAVRSAARLHCTRAGTRAAPPSLLLALRPSAA
jgi:hypothetical protein